MTPPSELTNRRSWPQQARGRPWPILVLLFGLTALTLALNACGGSSSAGTPAAATPTTPAPTATAMPTLPSASTPGAASVTTPAPTATATPTPPSASTPGAASAAEAPEWPEKTVTFSVTWDAETDSSHHVEIPVEKCQGIVLRLDSSEPVELKFLGIGAKPTPEELWSDPPGRVEDEYSGIVEDRAKASGIWTLAVNGDRETGATANVTVWYAVGFPWTEAYGEETTC